MSRKKKMWFEVASDETTEDCLARISAAGYEVIGRKEEPLFAEIDGEIVPIRQVIKFNGLLIEKEDV